MDRDSFSAIPSARTSPLRRGILRLSLGTLVLLASGAQALQAQGDWPERPVRIVVPSSPGGGTDVYARLLAQVLGEQLKQTFFVENRPGASGNIGADAAAKAPADGYTFLIASNSSLGISPVLFKRMPFDINRDLTPVTQGVLAPMVIVVSAKSTLRTFEDLFARGRSTPGTLAYGSAGVGSAPYMGVRMIEAATGTSFNHIPYKGLGPVYQDLLGGHVDFVFADVASANPHIASGRVRPLVLNQPWPALPGVPTLADVGLADVRVWISFSVMAPSGVPAPIISKLNAEIGRAMRSPEIAAALEKRALVPVFDTPEQFAQKLHAEHRHWGDFIRRHGISPG